MDELPRDEWPYGVDTIRLRMTWTTVRRYRPQTSGEIARGVSPWIYEIAPRSLRGSDAKIVPVADKNQE